MEMFTTGEIAAAAGVSLDRLAYIAARDGIRPSARLRRWRLWNEKQAAALVNACSEERRRGRPPEKRSST